MLRGNYRKFVSAFFFNLIHCNFVIFYVAYVARGGGERSEHFKN